MKQRMSRAFQQRWQRERLEEVVVDTVLQPRLAAVVTAPFLRTASGLVLEPLSGGATGREAFPDWTSYEAFINKVHVDDLMDWPEVTPDRLGELVQQGVKAAFVLANRLEGLGRYRIFVSLDVDSPGLALRFFERREGEAWGSEDPDTYALEEVLMIDT